MTSLRTAGAVAVPQGALTYTNAEAFTRKDLYLDIVGFHPASPLQERRPFAIVSEADQYRKHCRLQRFTEPNALDLPPAGSSQSPKAREGSPMSPSKSEAGSSPEAPPVSPASAPQVPLDFTLTPTASSAAKLEPPPTATLDSASAMTLDLRETQVKSPPPMLSEPAAPPLQQRRISARDAKIVDGAGVPAASQRLSRGNVFAASAPLQPFDVVITSSKAATLPQITTPAPKPRSRSPDVRGSASQRLNKTGTQPHLSRVVSQREVVDISITGVAPAGGAPVR